MADQIPTETLGARLKDFLSGTVKAQSIGKAQAIDGGARRPQVQRVLAGLMVLALAPVLSGCVAHIPDQPFGVTMTRQNTGIADVREFIYRDLGLVCRQNWHESVSCAVEKDLPGRLADLMSGAARGDSAVASVSRWSKDGPLTIDTGADKSWRDWPSESALVVHYDTGKVCHVHSWSTLETGYGYGYIAWQGKYGYGQITETKSHRREDCVSIGDLGAEGQAKLAAMRSLGQPAQPPATKPAPGMRGA